MDIRRKIFRNSQVKSRKIQETECFNDLLNISSSSYLHSPPCICTNPSISICQMLSTVNICHHMSMHWCARKTVSQVIWKEFGKLYNFILLQVPENSMAIF
ncbi:putative LRR receptor-like serine/threonine-protein kinase [Dirofilaria immitis]